MEKSFRLIAFPIAIAFSVGAFANEGSMDSAAASSAVETLKASLKG